MIFRKIKNLLSGKKQETAIQQKNNYERSDKKFIIVLSLERGGISRLEAFIHSLINQCHPNWILFLCDDIKEKKPASQCLVNMAKIDSRIHVEQLNPEKNFLKKCDEIINIHRPKFSVFLENPEIFDMHFFSNFINSHGDIDNDALNQGVCHEFKGKKIYYTKALLRHGGIEKYYEKNIYKNEAKLIAFYLPQYYQFPINDLLWGQGFNEWINTSQAKPLFDDHYQPHIPADLGYYDLRVSETRKKQIEIARKYGVYGFCYHYYWFGGEKVMHYLFDELLGNNEPDFPFCLSWANENWTRGWDGREEDIIIGQRHSVTDDRAFIAQMTQFFRLKNYIRVNGKPLFLVYRVNLLPDASRTVDLWRNYCRENGIGEIHLVAVQSFGITDPTLYGFDAAVEFPPHGYWRFFSTTKYSNVHKNFKGKIFEYEDIINKAVSKKNPNYTLYRGLMPQWDNTARKKYQGYVFTNSTPEKYKKWLQFCVDYSKTNLPSEERLIFVNAWNEWAEGCHLEPDQKFGRAYLEATREIVSGSPF